MEDIHAFLSHIKASSDFRRLVQSAAIVAGYSKVNNSDDAFDEMLNSKVGLIIAQVLFELSDSEYSGRTHHRRKLYNLRCRGPLCRKAERDRSRQRYQQAHSVKPRRYNKRASSFDDIILEYIAKQYDTEQKRIRERVENASTEQSHRPPERLEKKAG